MPFVSSREGSDVVLLIVPLDGFSSFAHMEGKFTLATRIFIARSFYLGKLHLVLQNCI
jgi:hypothetical protein